MFSQKALLKKNFAPTYLFVINILRTLLCIMFLLPTILKYNNQHSVYIYNFFAVYFIYLFYDVACNNKKKKINE